MKIEKETGRKLRGKRMAVLACGSDPRFIDAFFEPFRASAEYLGMEYLGELHTWLNGSGMDPRVMEGIELFSEKIKAP